MATEQNPSPATDDAPSPQVGYDAIFFDLDGTLLPIDMHDFLHDYYQLLNVAAVRAGFDPERFTEALNAGMYSMGNHGPDCTNADAFWDVFLERLYPKSPTHAECARAVRFLDDFYTYDFDRVGDHIVPNPAAAQALQTLHDKGYPIFLCTMPLFPLQGVLHRLKWAGVDKGFFERITTFDNSTDIKPSIAYYRENIELAGAQPERVLMVGNDTSDDLSCLQLGMDAYLVTDHLINPDGFDVESVKHGTLAEFAAWVVDLPPAPSREACNWKQRAGRLHEGRDAFADAILQTEEDR